MVQIKPISSEVLIATTKLTSTVSILQAPTIQIFGNANTPSLVAGTWQDHDKKTLSSLCVSFSPFSIKFPCQVRNLSLFQYWEALLAFKACTAASHSAPPSLVQLPLLLWKQDGTETGCYTGAVVMESV